jgi:hypothetical protein
MRAARNRDAASRNDAAAAASEPRLERLEQQQQQQQARSRAARARQNRRSLAAAAQQQQQRSRLHRAAAAAQPRLRKRPCPQPCAPSSLTRRARCPARVGRAEQATRAVQRALDLARRAPRGVFSQDDGVSGLRAEQQERGLEPLVQCGLSASRDAAEQQQEQ